MSFESKHFDESFIASLHEQLNRLDAVEYKLNRKTSVTTDTCWFIGPETDMGDAELRLDLRGEEIVVVRVCFVHQRAGVLTQIMSSVELAAPDMGVKMIRIESASTPEMVAWCNKHGFLVVQHTAIPVDNYIVGDYMYLVGKRIYDPRPDKRYPSRQVTKLTLD